MTIEHQNRVDIAYKHAIKRMKGFAINIRDIQTSVEIIEQERELRKEMLEALKDCINNIVRDDAGMDFVRKARVTVAKAEGTPIISKQLNEPELEDNYPVYYGYLYVADGKLIASEITGDVARLKLFLKAKKICRCDIQGRRELEEGKQ